MSEITNDVPGITRLENNQGDLMLFCLGRQAEIRPLKSGHGFRFRAPAFGWSSGPWSLKGVLRRVRRALRKAARAKGSAPIPWRKVAFYDNLETGGTMGEGVEALDRCHRGQLHELEGSGDSWLCHRCGRQLDPVGPCMPQVDEPLYSSEEVAAYDAALT